MNALAIMACGLVCCVVNGYLFYVPQWMPLKERLIDDRRAAGIFPQRPAATGIAPGARLVPRLREIEDEGRFIKFAVERLDADESGMKDARAAQRSFSPESLLLVDVDSQALPLWQQEAKELARRRPCQDWLRTP
jgi:hypothetical protein